MALRIKNSLISFFSFFKTKTFFAYCLSILLFALVFLYSGYALANNGTYRTYFYACLILFAVCLLGYYLVSIPIPREKRSTKEVLSYYFDVAKKDVSLYYLLFVILTSIISMIVNKDFSSNGLKAFVTNLFFFLTAFAFVKVVDFKQAISIFKKIFPWLCIVSLLMFGLINLFNLDNPFMSFSSSEVQYDNFFFIYFRFLSLDNRNCSIFWEPALFALFICFGTIVEFLTATNKIRWWVIAIYILSLASTFSTSGIVIFLLSIIISIAVTKNEIIKKNFVELIVVVVICFAGFMVIALVKPSILQKFILSSKNGSLSDRLYGPLINFRIMLDHPFGVGFSEEYSYFLQYAIDSKLLSGNISQTCTFGYWASAFGFLGLMFVIIPFVLLFFNKKMSLVLRILVIPLAILVMMAEPIQNNLAFLILIFYCLDGVRFPVKAKAPATETLEEKTSILSRVVKNPKNSIFVKNSMSAFIVRGLAMLVSLFTTSAYISYFMDPKGDGMLAVWFTILSILTWIFVFDLGVGHGLKNKLIAAYEKDDKKSIKTLISSSYFFAIIVSLIIFAIGSLVVWFSSPFTLLNTNALVIKEDALKLSLWIILMGVCLNFILKIVCNIFESLQKQGLSNIFAVFQSLILIVYATTLVLDTNEQRMIGLSLAYLVASTVPLLIGTLILFLTKFKEYKPSFSSISRIGIKSVVSLGGLFFVIQICMLLITNTNTILIQHIFNSVEAGATSQFTYYQKIFNIVVVVSQLLCGPIWVIIAKAKSSGDDNYVRKMNKILLSLICVFIAIDLIVFVSMPVILQMWIPNAQFTFSWTANAIFALNSIVVTSVALFTTISNGLSKLKYQVIGFIIGLFLKIISVVTIIILLNNGLNIHWYVMELTTTLAYLPVLILVPISNRKYLRQNINRKNNKVFLFSYFNDLVTDDRNAPLACESISLYVKEILDNNFKDKQIEYVNLAQSKKAFTIEKSISKGNMHQIGTVSFGKAYRKFIWKKNYWKKIYRFCENNLIKDDVMIIYHSLYTNHLLKKIKRNIGCKVILIGAELYSDVTGNKKDLTLEKESYRCANAHVLISNTLKENIGIERPSLILSGDYRPIDVPKQRFSSVDKKIHLVYAGTFDEVKGGVYASIGATKHLNSKYVLHILGFGDEKKVIECINKTKTSAQIILEKPLRGKEFTDFLAKCDIGLSVQNPEKEFNNSSFPSKIITYAKCGLSIISTESISVINSQFADVVNFTKFSDKEIANTIKNCKNKRTSKLLSEINNAFERDFISLVNNVNNSRRILITNNCYGGSTGNLSRDIAERFLRNGDDVKFCYTNGPKKAEFYSYNYGCKAEHYISPLLTRVTGNSLGYMLISTNKLIQLTKQFEPDLVNVHCMNTYSLNNFDYFNFLKESRYKTVIVNHGLYYATGSCGYPYGSCVKYKNGCGNCPNKRYACKSLLKDNTKQNWKRMYDAFKDSDFTMVSVSNYVKRFCSKSPITENLKNKTIINGVDTNVFKYQKVKFDDKRVHLLLVTSDIYGINKGRRQFLDIVDKLYNDDRFVFHLVCRQKIKFAERKNLVIHQNIASKTELAELYAKCNLFVLTSKNETFSLPVAESVCCGTPVLVYECGGPESILDSTVAQFYKFGDLESMVNYIVEKKYLTFDKRAIADYGLEHFSKEKMCEEYFKYFNKVMKQ